YQEQVMQAAQILAGYSLGGADMLRRAMGKKIKAEMDQQRGRFVEGAGRNNIDTKKANELFDLIDKFAGYGFNKSHAAAYALLAYQTAWLKAHYPHEFFAASMCFDMHQSEKLNIFVDDMRRMGVACLPPCINASEAEFSVEETPEGLAVRYALAGLKNVGEKAMEGVVATRIASGPFASLGDFADRVDPGQLNKRQIESLAAAGAFDGFEIERASVHGGADMVLAVAADAHRQRTSGQGGLFGDVQQPGQSLRLPASKPWAMGERMTAERDAFGFFFSAHPVTEFAATARSQGARPYQQVVETMDVRVGERKTAKVAALVEGCNRRQSKRGNAFVMVDLSDESGQFSASSFDDDIVAAMPEWASQSACLLIELEFDRSSEDQAPRATIRRARPLDEIKVTFRHRASIDVLRPEALGQLSQLVGEPGGGQDELHARLIMGQGRVMPVKLGNRFRLDAETIEALRALDGIAVRNVESFATQRPDLRLVS
ncbi:MAG: helix-hairpin-helix domain-containing protein, partial [Blastomonas fulva]|uniref:helix-hairpin-helix domain-containing protein n=1 Tax=Blastomonas fulva TaxID=1550728 RepID=UPI0040335676